MDLLYHVAVVGCGQLGGRLAKELSRFFHAMNDQNMRVKRLVLFDGSIVDADDVSGIQEFLPEDIGWHKSAVLAGLYDEAFSNIEVKGFGAAKDASFIKYGMGLTNVYDISKRLALIFDMSNGSSDAARAIRTFFHACPNCIVMTPTKDGLHIAIRLAGTDLREPEKLFRKKRYSASDAGRICRLCLTKTAQLITNGVVLSEVLALDSDGFGVKHAAQQPNCDVKPRLIRFARKNEKLLCVTVGCGGTGGNFIKDFVHTQMRVNERLSLLMVDGDRVEEKNLARQPFSERNILQNKASCLRQDLLGENPELKDRLFDHPFYLDTREDLMSAVKQTECDGKILLVGAVDNHRARQVLEAFYHSVENCIYIDAANEWSNGEVVVSVKSAGKEESPLRSFYYPDVLTDRSPSASESSCEVLNESAPQHFCTNLASANGVLCAIEPVVNTGKIRGGIFYFDAFREYGRFQEVWCSDF